MNKPTDSKAKPNVRSAVAKKKATDDTNAENVLQQTVSSVHVFVAFIFAAAGARFIFVATTATFLWVTAKFLTPISYSNMLISLTSTSPTFFVEGVTIPSTEDLTLGFEVLPASFLLLMVGSASFFPLSRVLFGKK